MTIKQFVFTPISVKAAILFLFCSITVVMAASNSCKQARGEFSLELMSIVITVFTVIIPFVVEGLTNQLIKEAKQEAKQDFQEIQRQTLEEIRAEIDNMIDYGVTKEKVANFRNKIHDLQEGISLYVKILYACQEAEKWLRNDAFINKLASDLTQFTLKNFNQNRLSTQFKKQFSKDIYKQIVWIYESIKVNTPQEVTSQQKSEMMSAKPNDFTLYQFAHEYLKNKKLPKHISNEAKAVIIKYDNMLTDMLKNHIN